jgi:hypothetical protein
MFFNPIREARIALCALIGALVLLQAFWDIRRTAQQHYEDDVEISAARRLPHAVGFEDAIY